MLARYLLDNNRHLAAVIGTSVDVELNRRKGTCCAEKSFTSTSRSPQIWKTCPPPQLENQSNELTTIFQVNFYIISSYCRYDCALCSNLSWCIRQSIDPSLSDPKTTPRRSEQTKFKRAPMYLLTLCCVEGTPSRPQNINKSFTRPLYLLCNDQFNQIIFRV